MFLPPTFLSKMEKLLPKDEIEDLKTAIDTHLRKSIRVNTLRGEIKEVKESLINQGFTLENMPWYKYGFFISNDKKLRIGNTFEHYLGKIYVQEASSMLPVIALDPKEDDFILDLAAAPGSKTTQLAMHMNNTGLIVANEPQIQRISALQENIDRSGCINYIITRNDGRKFSQFKDMFDKVLLDAPCSGEGTFQKDIKARYIWSQNKVIQDSRLQKQLIESAIIACKPGGTIIYSTCTLSPEEDEEIIDYALNKYNNIKLGKITFDGLQTSSGNIEYNGKEYNKEIKKVIKVWPHKAKIEGFFIAKIIKK
ncbi:MAG: tRNA methyltransferase [Candidatus Diapherotrites archaeon CG08_land_8_20_14_0_20_30_16]|nr:MAG: tRNA methyltransferase [Candidatus Diapherotrites archaeon CG08_land_8_20_14_0_20_30_16]